MSNLSPKLLAVSTRGKSIETLHHGWICVLNKEKKIIYKKGNISDCTFLRSAAKPIQAIPIIDNNLNVTLKELAIITGSHSGSGKHLEVLEQFMHKYNIKLSDLKCGIHSPLDESERNQLIKKGLSPNQLHNNCSGKHLGMLALCKTKHWNIKSYTNTNHPLQKHIISIIKNLSETKTIITGIDGCSVPTFSLSIINIAKLFSNFTNPENNNYKKIVSAITTNPFFIGGTGHIDTEIIKCSKGRLIAKCGAEGIIVVAYNGNCAVVKIADGSSTMRSVVMLNLLKNLNWLKKAELENSMFKSILQGHIKNHSGLIVGKINILLNKYLE